MSIRLAVRLARGGSALPRDLHKIQNSVSEVSPSLLRSSGRGQCNQTTPSPFTRAFRVLPSHQCRLANFSALSFALRLRFLLPRFFFALSFTLHSYDRLDKTGRLPLSRFKTDRTHQGLPHRADKPVAGLVLASKSNGIQLRT